MYGDIGGLETQGLGHKLAAGVWVLGRGPDLHLAVMEVGRAVLGLQGCVGDKGIGIGRLNRRGRAGEPCGNISVLTLSPQWGSLGKGVSLGGKA